MAERDDLIADYREFTREMLARFDRMQRDMRRELAAWREEMRAHHERQDRKLDEVIAENQAQRAALFAIIDHLGNGGPAAA
jgi:molybdenum-dependent DNA-binding transcriptional regulator ModE